MTEADDTTTTEPVLEPLPPSYFSDPKTARRTVPLTYPVTVNGREYKEIYLRRFSYAQVATILRNHAIKLGASWKETPVEWPIFVDDDGADLPTAVMLACDHDDVAEMHARAADFLPRSSSPSADSTVGNRNASSPDTDSTTEASS